MSEVKYQFCPLEADEMAEILYDMATDMDYGDYEDTREQTVKDLAEVLYKIKDSGYSNGDYEFLFNVLSNALYSERSLRKNPYKLADLLDELEAKELQRLKEANLK